MNLKLFNAAIAIGWLMVLGGTCMVSLALGLVVAGALLLVLTCTGARMAGIYAPRPKGDG